jgi:hypothetical protein
MTLKAQHIAAAGISMMTSVLLPEIIAALSERCVASFLAAYSFIGNNVYIWEVSIQGLILGTIFNHLLPSISNTSIQPL